MASDVASMSPPGAPGWVYVLTNAAMPGYIKIGLTTHDDWKVRVGQLDTTSTPLPFECYYAARVPDCRKLERTLHYVFGEKRARVNREFFTSEPDLAKAIIELVAIKEETLADSEQSIAPAQRREIEAVKAKAQRLTLQSLGLAPGSELTFIRDASITCVVSGPRTVTYQGHDMSVSQAALQAIHAMGYTWPTLNGFDYWTFKGIKLSGLAEARRESGSSEPA